MKTLRVLGMKTLRVLGMKTCASFENKLWVIPQHGRGANSVHMHPHRLHSLQAGLHSLQAAACKRISGLIPDFVRPY
jgi:hypothetical protein